MSEPSFFVINLRAPFAICCFCSSVSIACNVTSGTAALTALIKAGAVYNDFSIWEKTVFAPLSRGFATSGTRPKCSDSSSLYSDASIISTFVRVEVITNVQNITRLSDARNTSVQVSDMALFNLDDKFDDIKASIAGQAYADLIAYKDNEDKPIHVSELLRLLYAFDIDKYPDDNAAPVQSYSGKTQVFKRYKQAFESPFYKSLTGQIPLLVELYDVIERELPEKYRDYKKAQGVANPRFGSVRGIESLDTPTKTEFLATPTKYSVSSGYIYPIFGAFRSLLKFDEATGAVSWLFNPIDIWNEVGTSIVQNTFETYTNPQLAGKDKQLWLSNYRIVETQSLRKLLGRG